MSVVLAFATPANDPSDEAWLCEATHFVAFAGPDAQRWWASDGIGLGHAALHTSIDTPSTQPLSLDDRVWLSADARLDDRATLRGPGKGHLRRSLSCFSRLRSTTWK